MTATAIQEKQADPNIPLTISSLLREQYFGAGEGKKICAKDRNLTLALHYAHGKFPVIYTRTERFPGGESLDEMAERADSTIDEVLLPYVWQEEAEGAAPTTIAIVSHGLFIVELVARLVKRNSTYRDGLFQVDARLLRGLKNTAYTKIQVTSNVCCYLLCSSTTMTSSNRRRIIQPMEVTFLRRWL
jgi:broad specificity phosphatase PhoE